MATLPERQRGAPNDEDALVQLSGSLSQRMLLIQLMLALVVPIWRVVEVVRSRGLQSTTFFVATVSVTECQGPPGIPLSVQAGMDCTSACNSRLSTSLALPVAGEAFQNWARSCTSGSPAEDGVQRPRCHPLPPKDLAEEV